MLTEINSIKTHYEIHGNGKDPFVFLLHGWGVSGRVFEDIAKFVAQRYTVVSVDFPGFGQSGEPPEGWSVSDYASFTSAFIASFGCASATLLGHSFGGRVIIKLASGMVLPFAIDKIILVDSAGILPKRTLRYHLRVRLYKAMKFMLSRPTLKAAFPSLIPKLQKAFGSADYAACSEVMRKSFVKIVNEDLTAHLPAIKQPTLLIWGENDTATPVSDARTMERRIPDAGLVVMKDAAHFSFLDQPYIFAKVVGSFLGI